MRMKAILVALACAGLLMTGAMTDPAHAQKKKRGSSSSSMSIVTEEPGVLPKQRSVLERQDNPDALRRAWKNRPRNQLDIETRRQRPRTVVPGMGAIPNVPSVNQGNAGRETFQDRAIRCSHQSSLYGVPGSQSGAYIHNCAM